MNIQPYNSSYNVSYYGKGTPNKSPGILRRVEARVKQIIVDIMPEATFKDDKDTINKCIEGDKTLSNPAKNRLIMGATALLTQPAIDYYNHRVDDETRTVSRNRTIAKILAGTTVGIAVRGSCYKLVEKMTNLNSKGKHSKSLIPAEYLNKFKKFPAMLNNHRNALSTGIALIAMCFTNFLIDAPLTLMLTNKFNAKSAELKKRKEGKNGNV